MNFARIIHHYNFINFHAVAQAVDVNVRNGSQMLTVCPGEVVSLTCSHDNVGGQQTLWRIITLGNAVLCNRVVSHVTDPVEDPCGSFSFNNINDNTGSTLNSTIVIPVTSDLDGVVIRCFAGGFLSSPLFGNVTLKVISKKTNLYTVHTIIKFLQMCRLSTGWLM